MSGYPGCSLIPRPDPTQVRSGNEATLVADNLKRQWFLVVYFGIRDIKQIERKLVQNAGITTIILQGVTCCHWA